MIIAAATIASISVSAVAAENFQKPSGAQIRAKIIGMQLTDEVHWRYVYDRDGRLRSYSMGTKKIGKCPTPQRSRIPCGNCALPPRPTPRIGGNSTRGSCRLSRRSPLPQDRCGHKREDSRDSSVNQHPRPFPKAMSRCPGHMRCPNPSTELSTREVAASHEPWRHGEFRE